MLKPYINNIPFQTKTWSKNFALLPSLNKCELDIRQNPEQEKTKNVDQAKWNDLISRQATDKSTPPSAEGPQGLGDWRWMPCFRAIT